MARESPRLEAPLRTQTSNSLEMPPPDRTNTSSVVEKWVPPGKQHRQTPYVAIGSFLIACTCIMGIILILSSSDGQAVSTWPTTDAPVQPSVMLSIGAALANMSIRFMLFEGVVITWWKKAIRGTTVGELERIYVFGSNLPAAFTSGRNFNFVALASIMVSIVAIDGPLLQKASHVETVPWSETRSISVGITSDTNMVNHPTGYTTGRSTSVALMSDEFLDVARQYNNRAVMETSYSGCTGICTANVIAPGLDVNCTSYTTPLSITMTPGNSTKILEYSFASQGTFDASVLTLNTTARLTETSSVLTSQICTLHYAQVNYPVRLQNQTISLMPKTAENETRSLQYLPYESHGMGVYPSALGGIALLAQRKYGGTASLYMNGSPYELDSEGESALEYLDMQSGTSQTTDYTFLDPTQDMLSAIREIMFRTAVHVSNSSSPQTVTADDVFTHTVYSSNYAYLGGAIAVMVLAIIASSVNLMGWWELDRSFTLGPFEVAKAFNAPYLEDAKFVNSTDAGFRDITSRPIRYGEFVELEMERRNGHIGANSHVDGYSGPQGPMPVRTPSASPDASPGVDEGMFGSRTTTTTSYKEEEAGRGGGGGRRRGGASDDYFSRDGGWVKFGMGIPSNYR